MPPRAILCLAILPWLAGAAAAQDPEGSDEDAPRDGAERAVAAEADGLGLVIRLTGVSIRIEEVVVELGLEDAGALEELAGGLADLAGAVEEGTEAVEGTAGDRS
ncbi:hypothetical protein [Rubellimicrobium sp. CFH 75288]|uniref:hypothetical protein n=1 Tax=Rubellimicrobium sp. CFH 75288 TaxID=2697034 RepID=UPI00141288B6|nr:hypothetical protein [Rubellimicrobium sp. CFH 75288]NAZ35384.1 hypothetical protein [Rubellimicrobium sp. CFH 75288]